MYRRHRSFGPRTRTKKVRPPVRIKERIAKKGGRCSACRGRFEVGAEVTVVTVKRRTYHRHGCVPANVAQTLIPGAGPAVANTPAAVVQALSATWSSGEAKLVGMMALENALVCLGKEMMRRSPNGKLPDDLEKNFDRYWKLKAHVVRPGSENEGEMALREAVVRLVKTLF